MTTPMGRPARGRSAAIAARQRLAEQERARREATEKAIEGVWEAADAQDAAREALAAADADFRRHVDVLRAQGKSLDDIAELTGMPLADLRAARRGGAPSSDGDDGADGDVTSPVPDPSPAKPASQRRAPRSGGEQPAGDGGSAASADPAAGGAGGVGELSDEAATAAAAGPDGGGAADSS